MGVSTDAILAYGYDLGDPEDWQLEGVEKYGPLVAPWYDERHEEAGDFVELATDELLAELVGFTEVREDDRPGFHGRKRAAEEQLPVQVLTHCHHEYPKYLLAASATTAYRGDVKKFDPAAFTPDPAWDAALEHALTALAIRPTQERPQWLLCSYWG